MYEGILSREMKERASQTDGPAPCVTRQPTPAECVKLGMPLDKARQMSREELTKEDATVLMQNNIGPNTIRQLYGFATPGPFYHRLIKWGLHQKGAKPRRRSDSKQCQSDVRQEETDGTKVCGGGGISVDTTQHEAPAGGQVPENSGALGHYERLGLAVGRLVESKQKAYGNMVAAAVPIINALFPVGIPEHQMDDALIILRTVDKLGRIARGDKRAFGENLWQDIAGYALLAMAKDETE